jgi:shikimate dehydrogenase
VSGIAVSSPIGQAKILTGLAGREILASRSPWMHEQEASAQGFDLDYTLFDFTDRGWQDARLGQLLEETAALGYAGLNITYPFKQAIVPLLDRLSDAAQKVGAVNTVSFAGGKRTGHNTDVTGFAASFASGLPGVQTNIVLQIGAGGAGSATAHALLAAGVEHVILFDQDITRAAALVSALQERFGSQRVALGTSLAVAAQRADGLVNATPIGMAKSPGLPLPVDYIDARHWVADIVYFPLETQLLFEAKQRGCQTLNGRGMAVNQAAEAFELFTGRPADRDRMLSSFVAFAEHVVARHGN